jgi:uncharacterized membrane protein YdbT with pleckstrin-like domain
MIFGDDGPKLLLYVVVAVIVVVIVVAVAAVLSYWKIGISSPRPKKYTHHSVHDSSRVDILVKQDNVGLKED